MQHDLEACEIRELDAVRPDMGTEVRFSLPRLR
jgi:hypothetical protein